MSLLIKALRQAEKQNELAARQAADVAIDLPPEKDTESPQANRPSDQSPLSSALSLAVETHTTNTGSPAKPAADSSDFPTLDDDFEPTSGWQNHGEPNQAEVPARHDDSFLGDASGKPAPLSLEGPDLAPLQSAEEAPPEVFVRHAPETPPLEKPSPPRPEPGLSDEPLGETAPYLDVSAALPKRPGSGSAIAVLTGLTVMAVLVAAVTAGIMWWSGNQAYDTDFDAPLAHVTPGFSANNEALSRLDLGVPVSGTADTSSAVANPTDLVANKPAQASEFLEVTPPDNSSAQVTEPEQASTVKTGLPASPVKPAPVQAAGNKPASRPPAPTTASIPASTSRPALPAVRFVRSTSSREQSQQLLNDAYQALQRNELARAQAAYQQALRIDRNLIDGWVGLASVVARQGNNTLAAQHYQRALNIDPNDSVARTGLLALAGANLPDESESTLRTLIDGSQQNAMAELALANSLARQGRWAEAQQSYFNANAAQPNQPDTVFNLAVSLDRIRQPQAALSYYQQALRLRQNREALFDPTLARQRIASLKQQLQEQ